MRFLYLLAVIVFVGFHQPAQAAAKDSSFTGEISDSICAREGSHAEAMRMSKDMGDSATSCTLACVDHAGAKFVLIDAQQHKIYLLAPQDKARLFAGRKVSITGRLNKKTLEITTIAPAK